jgi:hypothetical protein
MTVAVGSDLFQLVTRYFSMSNASAARRSDGIAAASVMMAFSNAWAQAQVRCSGKRAANSITARRASPTFSDKIRSTSSMTTSPAALFQQS